MNKNYVFLLLSFLALPYTNFAQGLSSEINNNKLATKDSIANWSLHFQLTGISQNHFAFAAQYSGINSLQNTKEPNAFSLTSTIFLARKLWKNASININPETAGGKGISSTKGIAGFTNGETFRVGNPEPALYFARAFVQQNFPLKNTKYGYVESDFNQLAGKQAKEQVVLSAGKFSASDFFDDNKYSHDARTQFLNWSLMSNGAWDYAANTRGYTYGFVAELFKKNWEVRTGIFLEPKMANGPKLDWHFTKSNSITTEYCRKWQKNNKEGKISVLVFNNVAAGVSYKNAIANMQMGDSLYYNVINGTAISGKYGAKKIGVGINMQQDISTTAGIFARASYNDGKTATWAFTEIDNSISAGVVCLGTKWKRPFDKVGIALVSNGISKDHQDYLNAGGIGFMLGDSKLHYARESILEAYYNAKIASTFWLTFNYQLVANPAYNKDRGPANVCAVRLHVEM